MLYEYAELADFKRGTLNFRFDYTVFSNTYKIIDVYDDKYVKMARGESEEEWELINAKEREIRKVYQLGPKRE
jgi:hypothetical protein